MQTSYSDNMGRALAGMPTGNINDRYTDGSHKAAEALEPGRLVILNSSGNLEYPSQATGALAVPIFGIVVYSPMNEQPAIPAAGFTYPIGALVPVQRKGRIWAQVSSAVEPTVGAKANVKHSSTVATHRGKLTTDAEASTSGSEVAKLGPVEFVMKDTTTLWEVELNLPGGAST